MDPEIIAFIGIGLMGRGMARNLIRKGRSVRLYNRTRAKSEDVAQIGGVVADTPAEATRGADIIVTMLSDPRALFEVVEGKHGVLAGIRPGAVLIDSSTVSPQVTREVLTLVKGRGADMLDAPVFGSKHEAENGTLGFIVGGEAEVLARVQPVLDCMGRTTHVGGNGAGTSAKLVVNLIMASTLHAFNEGMVLAEKSGIDPATMLEIVLSCRARSGIIEMKAPKVIERDFTPFFPLRLMAKDIRLVLETAASLGLQLPQATALDRIYADAISGGLADEDFAATFKLLGSSIGAAPRPIGLR